MYKEECEEQEELRICQNCQFYDEKNEFCDVHAEFRTPESTCDDHEFEGEHNNCLICLAGGRETRGKPVQFKDMKVSLCQTCKDQILEKIIFNAQNAMKAMKKT